MSRPQFQLVPGHADREPYVSFCGHCGVRPLGGDSSSRVCDNCHMGMIVSAPESLAPEEHEAFLIVDGKLQVCAVSRRAEVLLGAPESDLVQDRLTEVLLPADGDAAGVENMIATISHAVRGQETFDDLVVRPAREWGIRWFTRVGPCTAPSAALIVLDPGD